MSAFGDLFRLFPAKVAEMCLDEAFMEKRPVYYFEEGMPYLEQRPRCEVCGRVAVFIWRDDRWYEGCDPPVPDLTQDACDDPKCEQLLAWFRLAGREGNRRRTAYREKFGERWFWGEPSDERSARMALVMLEFTIRERNDATNRSRAA